MNLIRLVIPLVAVMGAGRVCPIKPDARRRISIWRPPPEVFRWVWFALCLLLGYAWHTRATYTDTRHVNIRYGLLVCALASWPVVYGCLGMRRAATGVVGVSLALSVVLFAMAPGAVAWMLLPLVGWLVFAMRLSVATSPQSGAGNP